jgi:hypothetical protein
MHLALRGYRSQRLRLYRPTAVHAATAHNI